MMIFGTFLALMDKTKVNTHRRSNFNKKNS